MTNDSWDAADVVGSAEDILTLQGKYRESITSMSPYANVPLPTSKEQIAEILRVLRGSLDGLAKPSKLFECQSQLSGQVDHVAAQYTQGLLDLSASESASNRDTPQADDDCSLTTFQANRLMVWIGAARRDSATKEQLRMVIDWLSAIISGDSDRHEKWTALEALTPPVRLKP